MADGDANEARSRDSRLALAIYVSHILVTAPTAELRAQLQGCMDPRSLSLLDVANDPSNRPRHRDESTRPDAVADVHGRMRACRPIFYSVVRYY